MRVIFRDFAKKELKTAQEFPKQPTVSHGGPTGSPVYCSEGDWNGSVPPPLHAPWSSYSSSVLTHCFLVFRNKFPEVLLTCAHFRTGTQMCTFSMMLSSNLEVEKKRWLSIKPVIRKLHFLCCVDSGAQLCFRPLHMSENSSHETFEHVWNTYWNQPLAAGFQNHHFTHGLFL